jgi:hypothetical protein
VGKTFLVASPWRKRHLKFEMDGYGGRGDGAAQKTLRGRSTRRGSNRLVFFLQLGQAHGSVTILVQRGWLGSDMGAVRALQRWPNLGGGREARERRRWLVAFAVGLSAPWFTRAALLRPRDSRGVVVAWNFVRYSVRYLNSYTILSLPRWIEDIFKELLALFSRRVTGLWCTHPRDASMHQSECFRGALLTTSIWENVHPS